MICNIEIPHKAYSVNAMFYRDGRRKKQEAVQWERTIANYLRDEDIQEQLENIRANFDPKKHCIQVSLIFEFPKEILITKVGAMSSKAFDLSNIEKPLIDVIFLPSHSSKTCKNLELDDKYVSKLTSAKVPSTRHSIRICIELLPLQQLLDNMSAMDPTKTSQDPECQDHQDKEQL